jgi:hypothetical protein
LKSDQAGAPTLSVCCITRGPSRRVAHQIELLRSVAAEIVVAVDDRVDTALLGPLVDVADEVVLYPYEDPVDRPVGWIHALCRGDWILWLDDDELVSTRLLAELESLVRAPDVTHYWLTRRWLYRDTRSILDDAPWYPDYQLRLVRNDPALLWFPGVTHRPIEAIGPHRYAEAPIYHTDLLLNQLERRREKSSRYESEVPGKRIIGLPLNHAYYLPEGRAEVALAPVPEEDVALIEATLAGDPWGERTEPPAALRRATRDEIDLHWHGRPPAPELYRARLEPLQERFSLAARETRALDVRIANDGTYTWAPGALGSLQVRVSYRWRAPDGVVVLANGLRTQFPHAVRPGETALVAVDVTAPACPGPYVLELDLLHEHVRWFGTPVTVDVDVAPQPLVLLAGADERTLAELAAAVCEAAPSVEPVYVGTATGDEGYRAVPGARRYVLEGGRASRPALLWRAMRLLLSARRLRRGGRPVVADEFLGPLAEVGLVLNLGRETGRRERFQHRTAMRAARTLGIPIVDVSSTEEALAAVERAMPR